MAKYTKHNSNYIRTERHQTLDGGSSIFERDWVTIGSQLHFGPGKIPYYNDGNFIFTTSLYPYYRKKHKNGIVASEWTYDDVKDASTEVNQVNVDEYTQDLKSYAYYGSCVELVRTTIENIIKWFPGNLATSGEKLEVYKAINNYDCDPQNNDKEYKEVKLCLTVGNDPCDCVNPPQEYEYQVLSNPFQIDLTTDYKNLNITSEDNSLRYMSAAWKNYEISIDGGVHYFPIKDYKITKRLLHKYEGENGCDVTMKQVVKDSSINEGGEIIFKKFYLITWKDFNENDIHKQFYEEGKNNLWKYDESDEYKWHTKERPNNIMPMTDRNVERNMTYYLFDDQITNIDRFKNKKADTLKNINGGILTARYSFKESVIRNDLVFMCDNVDCGRATYDSTTKKYYIKGLIFKIQDNDIKFLDFESEEYVLNEGETGDTPITREEYEALESDEEREKYEPYVWILTDITYNGHHKIPTDGETDPSKIKTIFERTFRGNYGINKYYLEEKRGAGEYSKTTFNEGANNDWIDSCFHGTIINNNCVSSEKPAITISDDVTKLNGFKRVCKIVDESNGSYTSEIFPIYINGDVEQNAFYTISGNDEYRLKLYKEETSPEEHTYYQAFDVVKYVKDGEELSVLNYLRLPEKERKEYKPVVNDDDDASGNLEGWVYTDCIPDGNYLPDTELLNNCDCDQKRVLVSYPSNVGRNLPLYDVEITYQDGNINKGVNIKWYVYDSQLIPLIEDNKKNTNYSAGNLVIKPNDDVIEEYFNGLNGFERQLLTRKSNPLYRNTFITPIEHSLGYVYYKRDYTWPSRDGYCIDIDSTRYTEFLNRLVSLAELNDELFTDNLWRRMTHEAIKNYDWTYTKEFNEGDEEDNIEGGERMHKVLNIIGRVFDDLKTYIDKVKKGNRITYNGDRNVPNALLSDKVELSGWEVYSTIPNDKVSSDTIYCDTDNFTWYDTANCKNVTFADADVEFMRRLLLSSKRIMKTKGTINAIDMVMGLFGYSRDSGKYVHKQDSNDIISYDEYEDLKEDTRSNYEQCEPDYSITEEYYKVTPIKADDEFPYEEREDLKTYYDAVVRLNRLKQNTRLYNEDASGIPVGMIKNGDEKYLIPYYDYTKFYDGDFYFQGKGGWNFEGEYKYVNKENPQDVITVDEWNGKTVADKVKYKKTSDGYGWTETVSYLHVVPTVSDLFDVNPNSIKRGDIYYVANNSDLINYDEARKDYHFFAVDDEDLPDRYSSWMGLDINSNVDGIEDTVLKENVKKAKYLNSIIPDNIGNNPHVGYGYYDFGEEYRDYMSLPFKYAIENGYFEERDEEFAKKVTFDILQEEGEKIKIMNKDNFDKDDSNENYYYLNSKVIHLVNHHNNDEGYKKYFKEIIMKYLMQVIPSTTIMILENFE